MRDKKLLWYEFFAGGGMARIGLGNAWHCTFANDLSPRKAAAYRRYFGDGGELAECDIRLLNPSDLPGVPDLAWASFPCQDLSLAGNGAGLRGEHSGTFASFWRLMRGLTAQGRGPRVVVLENVVGALTSHGGRDFCTLVRVLSESGYRVGPLVINAVHFVPQSRPRLFIVAVDQHHFVPSKLLLSGQHNFWHTPSLVRACSKLPHSVRDACLSWYLPVPKEPLVRGLSSIIEEDPEDVEWHPEQETRRLVSMMSPVNRKKIELAQQAGGPRIGTIYKRTRPVDGPGSKRVQRAEVRFDDISGCLRTPVGGSSRQIVLVVEGKRIRSRLLSPREAARLMGVPEDYPMPAKYNDAYHLFGDGLVVPVVSWLEKYLLRSLALGKTLEQVA